MSDPIFTRVSIRQFTDEPVSDADVEQLMRAAMAAPSAGNQQPWQFVLTRDDAMKSHLAECSPFAKPAANADVVIVPCIAAESELRFPECAPLDLSGCVENILLEATTLGLGAVWLGIYPEQDRMAAVAERITIPEGFEPFALIAVGHPDEEVPPRSAKRYEPERIHWV